MTGHEIEGGMSRRSILGVTTRALAGAIAAIAFGKAQVARSEVAPQAGATVRTTTPALFSF